MPKMLEKYTAAYLRDLPTLAVGQADNLKIETTDTRVWLCRCGVADGMPYENQITIECLIGGRWVAIDKYEG